MTTTKFARTWMAWGIKGIGGIIGVTSVLAVILGAAMVTGALPPPAAQAANEVYLKFGTVGTQTTTPGAGGCLDCIVSPLAASGTVSCITCAAGAPAAGSFTLRLDYTPFPPSPCRARSVGGTLTVEWDTGQTSTASVEGRFIDSSSTLLLSGKFPTNPVFPGDPFRLVLNHYPPSPCTASTSPVSGVLSISTR